MKVTLWGTRGSVPSPGPENVRYGGNTACVEVRGADGSLLILDAGSGVRRLGTVIGPEVGRIDILLTHLHMDHILGLGFFAPLYQEGLEVHIWGPPSAGHDLGTRLARYYLSRPLFPVRLRDLPCDLKLHDVERGVFSIPGFEVTADLVLHPGPTVGYRIRENGASLAYLPDHEPALGAREFPGSPEWISGFDLAHGADLLIHDAQYTVAEYSDHVGWGHSAMSHMLAFARAADVARLVTFHHDPAHSDTDIDCFVEEAQAAGLPFPVEAGQEGATYQVGD
ncbi:MAG: MBL fold metallo-hydrolase [Dehalococcoidia bacterium]